MTGTKSSSAMTTGRMVAIIGSLAVAAFIMILNETVLTTALPAVMADFQISAATGGWLTTGFLLTMAVVIPTTGFFLQRYTSRTLFVAALGMFLVGTALAAFATGFEMMLIARIVQAIGTGIILPLLMTTTLQIVPAAHRGTIMGLNSVVISVGPALGPTLAGMVVDSFSWRHIFGGMLPLIVIALLIGTFALRGLGQGDKSGSLDAVSVLLSVLGFGGFVYGIGSMTLVFEGNVWPAVGFIVGIFAIIVFIVRQSRLEKRDKAPLLNFRPFGNKIFSRSIVVIAVGMATMLGTVVTLPIYLQNGLGITPIVAGLAMLPGGLIQAIISPIFGRVYDRVGPAPVIIPGAILLAIGQWGFAFMNDATPLWYPITLFVVFGAGMALIMTALMTHSLASLSPQLYSHGSAIVNTAQQLAGAIGTAVFLALFTLGTAAHDGSVGDGVTWVFIAGGIMTLIALITVFTIPGKNALADVSADGASAGGQDEASEPSEPATASVSTN